VRQIKQAGSALYISGRDHLNKTNHFAELSDSAVGELRWKILGGLYKFLSELASARPAQRLFLLKMSSIRSCEFFVTFSLSACQIIN